MFEIEEVCDHATKTEHCLRCGRVESIRCIHCGQDFAIPEYEPMCECDERYEDMMHPTSEFYE